jgi:hypothetical protein
MGGDCPGKLASARLRPGHGTTPGDVQIDSRQLQQVSGHPETPLRRISLCLKPLTRFFECAGLGASMTLKTALNQSIQWRRL